MIIGDKLAGKSMAERILKNIGEKLGPGILFAVSSVGTSHLVQSTRAGADYGLVMWGVILLALFVRYPAFRFGAEYAAATGRSLIDSYFQQGRWAVAIFILELLVNMFIATSAIALITGGILNHILPTGFSNIAVASLILVGGAFVLIAGKYHLLERVGKAFLAIFSVIIVIATFLTAPDLHITAADLVPFVELDTKTLLFIIALAGWMPTAMVASTFQSLWVCAKSEDIGRPVSVSEAKFDFNVGYISTGFLALCFLVLGTVLMGQKGIEVAGSSSEFAGQLVSLFTGSIGNWSYLLIVMAILSIMLSTVLTLMDACPRAMSLLICYRRQQRNKSESPARKKYYNIAVVVQVITCATILSLFTGSFKDFLDLATSIAFVVAPFLAFLNHSAMFSQDVKKTFQPGIAIRLWSIGGIVLMTVFAVFYLKVSFF